MVGHLHLLWHWCLDYAIDGHLDRYNVAQIAKVCDWDYDPETLVMALIECHFLDQENGKYKIHDWLDFCGDLTRRRLEYAAQKKERSREISRNLENSPTTVPYHTVPRSKETSKSVQSTRFVKPELAEVKAYIQDHELKVDPEKFCDFYESKGWLVGRSPMKSWRAAVRNWARNDFGGDKNDTHERKGVLGLSDQESGETRHLRHHSDL